MNAQMLLKQGKCVIPQYEGIFLVIVLRVVLFLILLLQFCKACSECLSSNSLTVIEG